VLSETRYTWDGFVLAEQAEATDSGERVTAWEYQPGTFAPILQTEHGSVRDAPQDEIDQRFYSIITDLTGAPSELLAEDGTLAGHQQRTHWGATVWDSGGASTPLRFPGQYEDQETGLHYNNQRYYDPLTGSYLSPDPLGLEAGPNHHAYVANPYVLIDPLGLKGCGIPKNVNNGSKGHASVDLKDAESAGGHAIGRHVGKDPGFLKGRGIDVASTFKNLTQAEQATANNISRNADNIDRWLKNPAVNPGDNLAVTGRMNGNNGILIYGSKGKGFEPTGITTVLKRTGSGYYVLTSYPIP
jgi:RHS repeat-associated protein